MDWADGLGVNTSTSEFHGESHAPARLAHRNQLNHGCLHTALDVVSSGLVRIGQVTRDDFATMPALPRHVVKPVFMCEKPHRADGENGVGVSLLTSSRWV